MCRATGLADRETQSPPRALLCACSSQEGPTSSLGSNIKVQASTQGKDVQASVSAGGARWRSLQISAH